MKIIKMNLMNIRGGNGKQNKRINKRKNTDRKNKITVRGEDEIGKSAQYNRIVQISLNIY
jgi:hypothetical protein